MTWGGDNVGTGFESVLINMSAFQTAYPGQTMTVDCRAYWYTQVGANPVTIAAVLWKGGTPTKAFGDFIWSNAGATGTLALNQILVPVTTSGLEVEMGQHVGTVTYSPTSGSGSIAL
jgi:quinol-cytochrome oxidoreductase complex cytochrome b subunit